MAISYRGVSNAAGQAAGVTTPAGVTSITPTLPSGTVFGDRVFLIECASNTSAATPSGWNLVGTKDTQVGTGAAAAAAGLRYMTVYWRDYTGWSMPAFDLTSAVQNSHWIAAVSITPSAGFEFANPTISTIGQNFNAATTAYTDTTAASVTTHSGGFLIIGTCLDDNVTGASPALTQTGATFASLTERADGGTATGNDVAGQVHTASVTTGASANMTFTETLSAASQGETLIVEETETALGPKMATFTDNFATLDAAKWNTGANISVAAGQLNIALTTDEDAGTGITDNFYDLTASQFIMEIPQYHPSSGQSDTFAGLSVNFNGEPKNCMFVILYEFPNLYFREQVNYTPNDTSVAFDQVAHHWIRIREAGGTIFWDTSPDGLHWTNRRSKTPTIMFNHMHPIVTAFTWGTDSGGLVAKMDNVNLPPPQVVDRALTVAVRRAGFY